MKSLHFSKSKSALLVSLGFILMVPLLLYRYHEARILSFNKNLAGLAGESVLKEIEIPSLSIKNQIEEGIIKDNIWYVSKENVVHLASSKNPGEGGNIIIYAHNTKGLFAKLSQIKLGDEIALKTKNDILYRYKTQEIHTVFPQASDFVGEKQEETLTLYTCAGFFDTKRFVAVAKPI